MSFCCRKKKRTIKVLLQGNCWSLSLSKAAVPIEYVTFVLFIKCQLKGYKPVHVKILG